MSKRRTELDKAIERIDNKIRVLNEARDVLLEQQNTKRVDVTVLGEMTPAYVDQERVTGRRKRAKPATIAFDEERQP
jgi:hypothetical protein